MGKRIFLYILVLLLCGQTTHSQEQKRNRKLERFERRQARNRQLQGEIQLSGAFALYPMVVRWAEEFRKLYPRVKIDISAGGAGKGITDALAGVVDFGMVSREIHPAEVEKGAFAIAVAKDAVVVTVNSNNPLINIIRTRGLTRSAAVALWKTQTAHTWGDVLGTPSTIPVHTYTRSDACGAADTWGAYLGIKQEDLEGTAVFGDPGIASVIQRDKIGIGFNNIAYAYNVKTKKPHRNIAVMPLDLNGSGRIDPEEDFYDTLEELCEAIAGGHYPSPPARELYLVCRGKPQDDVILEFLVFILTKGQQWTAESGYVPLSPQRLEEELDKIL
ncbi:Phosphate ABC transporter, periplasmic phosphate-binding protein PstS [Mucinivorans hirudinis]|uniref:Phosphate ABC transporter, periplasmic phosphate-binding protein PstS n=1 Tax=Mucinivorans hirudinis TaxID=1433126 RepID=A0A060REM1_9BACT|nr:Phosphate ABC transporter, periplasmic phosphate-binding protein PstS [Mucinivorans hirudinis]